jgi:hypothetical protein
MNVADKKWSVPGAGVAALVLLVLMAGLAGGAALRESVTVDEVAHIGAGVSYLQKLDMRMNGEHPPLPKVLAAIPLVLRGVRADYEHISWKISGNFFSAYMGQWVFGEWLLEKWNEPRAVLAWARLPMLVLTLALGWGMYVFGRRLGGAWGGVLCLVAYMSMPAFLAFGPLVHTDIAVTLFSVVTLWRFAEIWREPSKRNVLLFGLALAAALLSKFTAGILFVAFVAFALSLRWRAVAGQPGEKAELRAWRRARWRATFKGILWAALAVYVFYFIFSWHQPTSLLAKIGAGPVALAVRRMLMPPLLYLGGVFWVALTGRRPTFILGHAYPHGVWFYFPVVFTLKSTLGFLGLLVLSLGVAVSRRWREVRGSVIPADVSVHWRVLWVSLIVFTGVCILSPLDISIRHFSMPMALMILMLAPLPRMLEELRVRNPLGGRLGLAAMAVLAISCLYTAARSYPYYFPFVNSLSMGRPAYTLVNDSNVDWNQSVPEVKRFAEKHGLEKIGLDEYGFSDASVMAPQAELWDCQKPREEDSGKWVALSANMVLDGHNCGWVMASPHEELAGGSMYAVQLPARIPAVGSAGGPPLPSEYRTFGGAPFDIRALFRHVNRHPEDLPRVLEWFQKAYGGGDRLNESAPKAPWEQ